MPPRTATIVRETPKVETVYTALLGHLEQHINALAVALLNEPISDGHDYKRAKLAELLDLTYKVRRHIEHV